MNLEQAKTINICDKISLFSLYIVAFFFPISKGIIELFSIIAILSYVYKKVIQREDFINTPLNAAIFLYLATCFISVFLSSSFKVSIRNFSGKNLQQILFFFVVAETLNNKSRIKTFLYFFLSSSLVIGIDGIYQHFTHKDFIRNRPYYGLPRIHATFPTPNDLGCYLVSIMPFVITFFLIRSRIKLVRYINSFLFALLFVCLVLTASRGAWLAFIGVIFFVSVWIRSVGVFFLVLLIFLAITQQFYAPLLKERFKNFFVFKDVSSIDRKVIWHTAWKMFISRPWLGLGVGTFMLNFEKFAQGHYLPGLIPYTHNCYLQMATEIGIIGLIFFLSIIVIFFYQAIRALNKNAVTKGPCWYVLLASSAALVGYSIQMFVDTSLYSLDLGLLFWLLLGIGIAAMNNIQEAKAA